MRTSMSTRSQGILTRTPSDRRAKKGRKEGTMTHSEVELCKLARVAVGGSTRQNALGSSRHTSTHSRGYRVIAVGNRGGWGGSPYGSRNFVNPMDEWGSCERIRLRECHLPKLFRFHHLYYASPR